MSDSAGRDAPVDAATAREQTWLDAIEEFLDATIERDEEFECRFDEFTVDVPLRMRDDPGSHDDFARWRFDGTMRVRIDGTRGPLAEWLRWWYRQFS